MRHRDARVLGVTPIASPNIVGFELITVQRKPDLTHGAWLWPRTQRKPPTDNLDP